MAPTTSPVPSGIGSQRARSSRKSPSPARAPAGGGGRHGGAGRAGGTLQPHAADRVGRAGGGRPLRWCGAGGIASAGAAARAAGLAAWRRHHPDRGALSSEIQPLVEDFNRVLAVNADMVQRARTQAGNLAQSDAAEHPGQCRRARGQSAGGAGARAGRAGAAPGRSPSGPRAAARAIGNCAAAAAAGSLAACHAPPACAARAGCRPAFPADLAFRGDEQDLQEMAGNLLDNACKWAAAPVRHRARDGEGMLLIHIDDDGPGIPEDERERIFERGAAGRAAAGIGAGTGYRARSRAAITARRARRSRAGRAARDAAPARRPRREIQRDRRVGQLQHLVGDRADQDAGTTRHCLGCPRRCAGSRVRA